MADGKGSQEVRVKVAVRCRPMSKKEKDRGCKSIISMEGPTTIIEDPSGRKNPRSLPLTILMTGIQLKKQFMLI